MTSGLDQWMREAYNSHEAGDLQAAERGYRRILSADPGNADALYLLGEIANRTGRHAVASDFLQQAVAASPRTAAFHHELGMAWRAQGHLAEAERCYRKALELEPGLLDAHVNLAAVLLDQGAPGEAQRACRKALEIDPTSVGARINLALTYETGGAFERALACYDEVLHRDAQCVQAHVNRAAVSLMLEDYAAGWREFEWRLRDPAKLASHERFALPRWDGSPLQGRTILIYAEQGLGDEIMYASCFAQVIERARHVFIDCEPRLEALFRRSFPRATIHGASQAETPAWFETAPRIDFKVAAGSLPMHLRGTANEFPRHSGYLRADPGRVEYWRARLESIGAGRKIGLSWRGGIAKTGRTWRSLALEQLLPVLARPGVHFVSLQYGDCAQEVKQFLARHGIEIHHWQTAIHDYDETAALICALDLTLSVCTAVVHLGGALGRPVWVMAPRRPEARYGFTGETMRWYPSVRMFRQTAYGEWSGVIDAVGRALRSSNLA